MAKPLFTYKIYGYIKGTSYLLETMQTNSQMINI